MAGMAVAAVMEVEDISEVRALNTRIAINIDTGIDSTVASLIPKVEEHLSGCGWVVVWEDSVEDYGAC